MPDNRRYTFDLRRESGGGRFSALLGLCSTILFAICVLISFSFEGHAGSFVGAVAFTAALLSVYGFYVGMKSFNERDVSPTFSIIGSIICGVIMVGWLTLILIGLV
jgi:hypothetical protein